MVAASAGLILLFGVGAIFGPIGAGLVMEGVANEAFFVFQIALHLLLGIFALYRMTRRPAIPLEEQGAYVPMAPRATATVAAMSPEWSEDGAAEVTACDDAATGAPAVPAADLASLRQP